MEFNELINKRFSARTYTSVDVTEEQVDKILAAIEAAPSAGNSQSYKVVVVRDPDIRKKLADISGPQGWISNAPVVIAFFADLDAFCGKYAKKCIDIMTYQDPTIAMAYAQLAAVDLGLGSAWVGPFGYEDAREIVGLEGSLTFTGLITVGYTMEDKPKRKRRKPSEWSVRI